MYFCAIPYCSQKYFQTCLVILAITFGGVTEIDCETSHGRIFGVADP
jgi:hypothetical protein